MWSHWDLGKLKILCEWQQYVYSYFILNQLFGQFNETNDIVNQLSLYSKQISNVYLKKIVGGTPKPVLFVRWSVVEKRLGTPVLLHFY